jgi:iron complex outermembrane receptor protein
LRGSVSSKLKYDLTGYIIHTRDDLIPFQVPSAPGQDYYRNAGSTVHRGGEFSIRYLPFTFLEATASVTYIDAYFKNYVVDEINYRGNKMPGVTPIREVMELKFHAQQGLYGTILMQNSGKVYVDDANTATAESHTVFDLGVGHTGISLGSSWVTKLVISGGLSNVFNTRYITAVTINAAANRYYEPGPGRTVYFNARVEFGKR